MDEAACQALTDAGTPPEVVEAYAAVGGLPYLDFTDTVFGQVYQGMDVVDEIALVRTDDNGLPEEPVLIQSVTIAAYGE